MSLGFIPCEPIHLASIIPTGVDGYEDTRHNILNDKKAASELPAYARALVVEGKTIAIIGISPRWTAVCYAWAIPTDEAKIYYPLLLTRETHKMLGYAERVLGMKRIEASVKVDFHPAIRWIESLGFRREGTMRNFGPGGYGDFYLYARTRDE